MEYNDGWSRRHPQEAALTSRRDHASEIEKIRRQDGTVTDYSNPTALLDDVLNCPIAGILQEQHGRHEARSVDPGPELCLRRRAEPYDRGQQNQQTPEIPHGRTP